MKILKDNWIIFDDEILLAKSLAQNILNIAKKLILKNDRFSIVLTGGQSVLSLYKILSKADSNWDKWHIYIGDERCLPLGDKDRNDYMINKVWLNNSLIPKDNIHFMHAELGVDAAASHYKKVLIDVEYFDVVLLSAGEDGHAASLFPKHSYDDRENVVVEKNSPKYPLHRVSMSYSRFNKSKNVFKIVSGSSKKIVLKKIFDNIMLPINKIQGNANRIYITQSAIN